MIVGEQLRHEWIVLALQEAVLLHFFPGPLLGEVIDAYLHKGSHSIRQGDNASAGRAKSAVYFREGFDAFFYVVPADVHPRKDLLVVVLCSFYPKLRWAASIGEASDNTPLFFCHPPLVEVFQIICFIITSPYYISWPVLFRIFFSTS